MEKNNRQRTVLGRDHIRKLIAEYEIEMIVVYNKYNDIEAKNYLCRIEGVLAAYNAVHKKPLNMERALTSYEGLYVYEQLTKGENK